MLIWSSHTESRYGTNSSALPFFPFLCSAWLARARDDITFPRVVRDLLMFAPSFKRCPVAPVELARSDPAKSTRLQQRKTLNSRLSDQETTNLILDTFSVSMFVPTSCLFMLRRRVKTACEREDLRTKQMRQPHTKYVNILTFRSY